MKKLYRIFMIIFISNIIFCQHKITLDEAYKNGSIVQLEKYLDNWEKEYSYITDVEFEKLSNLSKSGYLVYKAFYDKNNYFKKFIKDSSSLYVDSGYFIVMNNLIVIRSTNPGRQPYDSLNVIEREIIHDFRPNMSKSRLKVLYLTDKYMTIFSNFLMGKLINNNTAIETNREKYKEVLNRVRFLYNRISILTNGRGYFNYWSPESHPTIAYIEFNERLSEAYVGYFIEYNWGEAKFILNDDKKWIMLYSKFIGG